MPGAWPEPGRGGRGLSRGRGGARGGVQRICWAGLSAPPSDRSCFSPKSGGFFPSKLPVGSLHELPGVPEPLRTPLRWTVPPAEVQCGRFADLRYFQQDRDALLSPPRSLIYTSRRRHQRGLSPER